MSMDFLDNFIVKHLAGSHAYGTSTPTSDTDYRGIFLANKEFIMTPFFNVREVNDTSEEDTKFYELNRYMKLYLDANPNILETLWVDESDIVESTDIYDHLRTFNADLLSTKIAFTYTGYAYNQVTRMKNHHGWMDKERIAERRLNEIVAEYPHEETVKWMYDTFPEYLVERIDVSTVGTDVHAKPATNYEKFMRDTSLQLVSTAPLKQYHFVKLVNNYGQRKLLDRDFNLQDYNYGYELIHYGENIFGIVINHDERTLNGDGSLFYGKKERTEEQLKTQPLLIVKFNEKEYKENSENRKNYHKWKANRNEKRSELESLHGYDTKHAMHVIRLLRTAEEALESGIVHVKRPDAAELLDIRNGKWTYSELMQYYDEKQHYIRDVLYKQSMLPKKPNIKLAAKVLIDIREMQWYGK